jgi:hypothetical protein
VPRGLWKLLASDGSHTNEVVRTNGETSEFSRIWRETQKIQQHDLPEQGLSVPRTRDASARSGWRDLLFSVWTKSQTT